MHSLSNLIRYNIDHLKQGSAAIQGLSDVAYTRIQPPVFESSIGEHFRHVFEHYVCFLYGTGTDVIDYDARNRDVRISSQRQFALKCCDDLCAGLQELDPHNRQIRIKMSGTAAYDESSPWSESNIKRELQYLQAHTIHHYALISMIMRIQGIDSISEFGVAPSTLRHRANAIKASVKES